MKPWRMRSSRRPSRQRERYDVPMLCAGGVMASQVIRARMEKRFGSGVSFAEPTLSGDNAVGVAVLAARLCNRKAGAGRTGMSLSKICALSDKQSAETS
ncbi:MAG: hypothetical protein ACLR4Z_07830 [Butyricicoccaceae bacterium]